MALTKVSRGLLSTGIVDNSNATAITIDSSENVGIGMTPASTVVLDITEADASTDLILGLTAGTGGRAQIRSVAQSDGTSSELSFLTMGGSSTSEVMRIDSDGYVNAKGNVATDNAPDTQGLHFGWNYSNGAGESLIVFNRGAGTTGGLTFVDNSSSGTHDEVMRLESGNLGLGTTAPSRLLHLKAADSCLLQLQVANTTGNCQVLFGDSGTTTAGKVLYNHTGNVMSFETNSTEAMRINGSQRMILGSTTGVASGSPADGRLEVVAAASNNAIVTQVVTADHNCFTSTGVTSSSGDSYRFGAMVNSSGSVVGTIVVNHGSTAYNTSSDYRLKENVTELTNATNRLKQLQPKRFNFIEVPDATIDGFLAHEVSDIVPEAVSGTKDAVDADGNPDYQGIDQSKLVPLLVATIQELEARIAKLESN